VNDESEKVNSSGGSEKTTAAGAGGSSSSTSAARVKAKVESVEDHKKLNYLGKRNIELKRCTYKCLLVSLDMMV